MGCDLSEAAEGKGLLPSPRKKQTAWHGYVTSEVSAEGQAEPRAKDCAEVSVSPPASHPKASVTAVMAPSPLP
jgi:hypothetical protein